jgi:uncharacterized protein (DUF1697 family)
MKYIALLRGINVSGNNVIKMADLIKSFEKINFRNIKTYVQSGNVIFDYELIETAKLENKIEENISQTFGLSVKTIVRTSDELMEIINNNPFTKEQNVEFDKLHITLLSEEPEPTLVSALNINKEKNEIFKVISREVYLYCPNGYARTKLNNTMFEKKLNTSATTRNWKTIIKLLEISKKE